MSERGYHEMRAAAELKLAEETSDPQVAAAHQELARLHELSAREDAGLPETATDDAD